MTSIDAHLHLWNRDGGYRWLDAAPEALREDFSVEQARAELDAAGVDRAVLVQADDTEADTAFLLDTGDAHPWIAGVVGWVPIDDATRAEAMLDRLADRRSLRGVRQLLHDDPRDGLLLAPDGRRLAALLAERGLTLDIPNAYPRLLADATTLARAVEGLTVVIDHLAKPPSDAGPFEAWSAELVAAAALPNTVAKVSGLCEAGRPFTASDARRAWELALDQFGPDRLMLGGDWPVSVTSGGYAQVWQELTSLLDELSPAERGSLLGGTATRVYGLVPG
ncbi:MAG TPA: amidohydrolase family protein [Plantibacter sp.]|uniref:amidohydrolase family protein n=1 Tax=unclassified Plantibacter TaxID=2624265 RepID=UPI002CF844B7|nr:amidohydrolase family protein [Plantibacter sp.]